MLHVPGLVHRYIPPADGGLVRRVILVLHGRGDSPAGFYWLAPELGLPEVAYLLLQAPDDYYGGWSWYDLPPNQGPGILRSRALLFGAIDALAEQGVASEDVVLFGFSQGCLVAIDVGLRYPKPLAGVCGISGYVMWPDQAAAEATPHAKTMPWLVTDGSLDGVVPHAQTAPGIAALQAAGVPVDYRTFPKGHTIEPQEELPLIRTWLAATSFRRPTSPGS